MKILIDCTLDVVFKTIFKSKNTRFYVASIISEFLKLNYDYVYQNMQILDGELPKDNLKKETYLRIGKEEGEVIGARKTRLQNAKKMLEKGLDINLIKEITGLSEKEIKNM